MEKGKAAISEEESISNSLHNLHLKNHNPKSTPTPNPLTPNSQLWTMNKGKVVGPPRSLLSLCLGVVGTNLEDIIDHLSDIALTFPSHIKMVLVAIARRRKLLNDDIVFALSDPTWETLDMSGSNVSDSGLCHVVNVCRNLRVVDISRCSRLTYKGVSKLLQFCPSLEILRWGYALIPSR